MAVDNGGDISQVVRMQTPDGGVSWVLTDRFSGEGRASTVVLPLVADDSPRIPEVLWLEGRLADWEDYGATIMASTTGRR